MQAGHGTETCKNAGRAAVRPAKAGLIYFQDCTTKPQHMYMLNRRKSIALLDLIFFNQGQINPKHLQSNTNAQRNIRKPNCQSGS